LNFDIVSSFGLRISDLLRARAVDVFAQQVVIAVVFAERAILGGLSQNEEILV